MRGEYGEDFKPSRLIWELPPRARRILAACVAVNIACGTTSACAENTGCGFETFGYAGNYLRVRGEYIYKSVAIS